MKIGHYAPNIWAPGGVASYIRRVSQEQQRLGHDVVYYDLCQYQNNSPEDGQPVHYVNTETELFRRAAKEGMEVLHLHMGFLTPVTPTMPAIRTVHGHQPYCPSGGRFLNREELPCPRTYSAVACTWGHIVDRCGSIRPQKFLEGFRNTQSEMRSLRTIPSIAVSNFVKEQMVLSGYPAELISVVPHPAPYVSLPTELPATGVPRFLYMGRITPKKGVGWLLKALSKVKSPVHLDIAGDGYEKENMQNLSKELGITQSVTFHDWVGPEKVESLLSETRALIFPSLWHEPAGLVALEAMAHARAVVVSKVGGAHEFVTEGANGLLVEPGDVNKLASAIDILATDWSLAQRMGETGLSMARNSYSMQSHIQNVMHLYGGQVTDRRLAGLAA